jgi:hypothetical protein
VIDHGAGYAVRVLLHPRVSPRAPTPGHRPVGNAYSFDAIRYLIKPIASDVAEPLDAFVEVNHRDPVDVLDAYL